LRAKALLWAAVGAIILAALAPATAAPRFTVTDLGVLGGWGSDASVISARGVVVGSSTTGDPGSFAELMRHAFLWRSGKMTDLGTLGGEFSGALGINDKEQVVGSSHVAGGRGHAFLWRAGKMTRLSGIPKEAVHSRACGINNRGQVAGDYWVHEKQGGQGYAFLWRDGKLTRLGKGSANGINNKGQVIGRRAGFARLWTDGKAVDLVVPPNGGWIWSEPNAINEDGMVVGTAARKTRAPHFIPHPVVWRSGKVTVLPTAEGLGGGARGVNNRGRVVGTFEVAGDGSHAFLFQDGVMHDLNQCIPGDSGWVLISANAINDRGEVVGTGEHNGHRRAFRLTPVAEGRSSGK
jgi:probable HAF family extracellular repeat protein